MAPKKGKAKAKAVATKADPPPKAATKVESSKASSYSSAGSLKAGFDAHANKAGYLNVTDKKAIAKIAAFLELDPDIVGKEMAAIDYDANNFISFAEFALWADKHTVGIPLGIDVPDKRQWQKGCPDYWTTIPEPEELEEIAAPASSSFSGGAEDGGGCAFVPVPEDPDPSELESLIGAAKEFEWDKAWEVLDEHPGYVDMRPPYRKFAAIHQAAFEGQVDVLRKYVEEYRGNPKLLSKDGETPEQVAKGEGHTEAAKYLAEACSKAYAPMAGGAKRLKLAPVGRGGAPEDPALMDKAHEIIEAAKWQKWDEMFKLIKANPGCVNLRPDVRKFGAIHQVAFGGDAATIKRMVEEFKVDPCLMTRDYETPLEIAKLESNTEIVEYLSKLEGADSSGASIQAAHALIDAAKDGKWEKVFEMLDKSPELVNERPQVRIYGVMHQAAFLGEIEILRRLIEDFKANVKLLSKDGKTPLDVAIEAKKESAANYLEACTPTIKLDDDFITYPDQEFVRVEDEKVLSHFRSLLEKTHKKSCNWTRDRDMASGVYSDHAPVPTGYELVGVVRNENPPLWRMYQVYREVTRLDCLKTAAEVPWKPWKPITMDVLDWSGFGYCAEANEWPLLHASIPEALNAIARTGFTMKKLGSGGTTGSGGLYGDGTYLGDSITKADEYARRLVEKGEFKGCRTAALTRVVGGRHFYTDKDVADKDKPKFAQRVLEGHYHTTVGDRLKLKNTFREYVVYDACATYLEYIIYYRRKGVPKNHL